MKKGYCSKVEKGSVKCTKKSFMRLRNDSYKAQMHVYLIRSSKEMNMNSGVFGLSNTKHLRRNAVLR